MSIFARTKRPSPAPTITGAGSYRLYDNHARVRNEQRFESLAAAMAAGGNADPDDWSPRYAYDQSQYILLWSTAKAWAISAPGVVSELKELQAQKRTAAEQAKRAAEEKKRQEINARHERRAAAEMAQKAKKAAEDAAKPKVVISYLTVAGQALRDRNLAVEVFTRPGYYTSPDHTETVATCKVCGESETVQWNGEGWRYSSGYDEDGRLSTPRACELAQKHAETCRALPKPEVPR